MSLFKRMKKVGMTHLLPVFVVIIALLVVIPLASAEKSKNVANNKNYAKSNARVYADEIYDGLERGVVVANAIKQTIIASGGTTGHFETIARNLLTKEVHNICLIPENGENKIYPAIESDKIDIMNGMETSLAKNLGEYVVSGLVELSDGQMVLLIDMPIYLTQINTAIEYFWGTVVIALNIPQAFEEAIDALEGFGYDYVLTMKLAGKKEEKIASSSVEDLTEYRDKSFEFGDSEWVLKVSPVQGWNKNDTSLYFLIGGCLVALLIGCLVDVILMFINRSDKYKSLASEDILTGLLNRMGFANEFEKYLRNHSGEKCVEAELDVDDFKIINDLYGHNIGDSALRHLADDLKGAFPNAILARNGGDEFSIVIKGCDCNDVADELRRFVKTKRTFWYGGVCHSYSISMGYAEYPLHAKTKEELAIKSDMALYEAKLHGKNHCFAYNDSFHIERRSKLGFALHEISENLPVAFLIYKADKDDDTVLFANSEMVRLAGCSDLDEFMNFCGNCFSGLVNFTERGSVKKSIWKQIDSCQDGCNDYVEFNLAVKGGKCKHVINHGRIIESENYGKVFYALIMEFGFIGMHYGETEDKDL